MAPGSLVTIKNSWVLGAGDLGVVIKKSNVAVDAWVVLWSSKSSYKIQDHLENSLLELSQGNLTNK